MREVHYKQQRRPKLVRGMNNAFVSILPIHYVSKMTVIKVESGKDGIKGGRLKWLRECKSEHQRGRGDISVSCRILSWLVLHLHFPSLSLSSFPGNTNRFDNSVWKQLPQPNATAMETAHCCVLHSDVYTGIYPPFYVYFLQWIVRSLHYLW